MNVDERGLTDRSSQFSSHEWESTSWYHKHIPALVTPEPTKHGSWEPGEPTARLVRPVLD